MGNKNTSSSSSSTSSSGKLSNIPEGRGGDASNSENVSYYEMAKNGYTELVNAIIRPPVSLYTTATFILL